MSCAFLSKLDVLNKIFKYFGQIRLKSMFSDGVHYVQRVSRFFVHPSLSCTTNMSCSFQSKLDVLNQIFKYFGQIQLKTMFSDGVHYVQRVSCFFLHLSLLCTTNMSSSFGSKLDVLNRIFKYSVSNRQKFIILIHVHDVSRVSC